MTKYPVDTDKIVTHLTTNWKTSAIGLSILLADLERNVVFDAAGHLAMTPQNWFLVGIGVATFGVSLFQKDAGVTQATTPSGEVKPVDSHEVPDDPADQAVTQ